MFDGFQPGTGERPGNCLAEHIPPAVSPVVDEPLAIGGEPELLTIEHRHEGSRRADVPAVGHGDVVKADAVPGRCQTLIR